MDQDITLHTVYQNEGGCVKQSDTELKFYLHFQDDKFNFRVCDFIKFKRQIQSIDLDAKLSSSDNSDDVEIIFPAGSDRCLILTLSEIIQMKDLMDGAFVMLSLNSIITERIENAPSLTSPVEVFA